MAVENFRQAASFYWHRDLTKLKLYADPQSLMRADDWDGALGVGGGVAGLGAFMGLGDLVDWAQQPEQEEGEQANAAEGTAVVERVEVVEEMM